MCYTIFNVFIFREEENEGGNEMSGKYNHVFSPVKIGNLELKNRIQIAPMEGTNIIDWLAGCKFQPHVRDYYIERAKDGVGLMIPGMIPVRSMVGGKWLHKNPKVFEPVKPLMDEIHKYGAKVFFQLGMFAGRNFVLVTPLGKVAGNKVLRTLMKPIINLDINLVSADEGVPNVFMPEHKCRALSTKEVEDLVEAYAQSALLCKNAGVDGVEVHAVHEGYLMDQFTLPYTNHRTDKYGGSFENRYRFAVEVVQRIKELCGADYPVSMRYSVTSKTMGFNSGAVPGEEFTEVGRTMEESEKAIRLLQDAGVDMFNCDNGTYDAWFWAHPPVYMPLNCNLADVSHIRKFVDVPVYCAGRMQMEDAEQAIANGDIDGVAIGRQFLSEDTFITKTLEGRDEDIRPCIACHSGCLPCATYKGVGVEMDMKAKGDMRMCALNPRVFCEQAYDKKAAVPKKIAIVGGGVGGMETALEAAQSGHDVTLYEKSEKLGGAFIAAAALSFKEKDKALLEWYETQLKKSNVKVVMNTEITDLSTLEADEIVIATGAAPRGLPIEGAEKAIDAVTYLLDQDCAGENVVVIGGGLTGCEIAYELALQGKKPVVVEMLDDLIKVKGVNMANSTMLKELLRYHKVPVYLETKVKAIRDGSVVLETKDGEKEIPADSVIKSIGYVPGSRFDEKKGEHVHILGDAAKVGNLKTVIWGANDLVNSWK